MVPLSNPRLSQCSSYLMFTTQPYTQYLSFHLYHHHHHHQVHIRRYPNISSRLRETQRSISFRTELARTYIDKHSKMSPRSAAIAGLHNPHRNAEGRRTSSHFYRMSDQDMKLFVRVLLQRPVPKQGADKLKQSIKALPSHLKASGFHRSPSKSTGQVQTGYLCDTHKSLKKGLCYELLSLIQSEISHIGDFTYPVIMSGKPEAQWEHRVRQLEPVPGIYTRDFTERDCTPPGHEPIWPGNISDKGDFVPLWCWEVSQCPACILARIGSERTVLFALLTGMVARISRRRRGPQDNLKSRRVRFVKEWLQASHKDGKAFVNDAFVVGQQIRDIRREQRVAEHTAKKQALRDVGRRANNSGEGHQQYPPIPPYMTDQAVADLSVPDLRQPRVDTLHEDQASSIQYESPASSVVGVDISDSYAPAYQQASTPPSSSYTYSSANPESESIIGFDISEPFIPHSPAFRQSVAAGQESLPRRNAEGTGRESNGTIVVGFDLSEPFLPAPSTWKIPPRSATPARQGLEQRGRVTWTDSKRYSIASSFASDVSLSNICPPTGQSTELLPQPLRIRTPQASRTNLPPILEPRVERQGGGHGRGSRGDLPIPHPNSIYGTYGMSARNTHRTTEYFIDVSPPSTPVGYGDRLGQYDVSPLASPVEVEFGMSPPDT